MAKALLNPIIQDGPLELMRGHTHAHRAIEVALAGVHTILFISIGNRDDAEFLVRWCWSVRLNAGAIAPCPCGNLGSAERACVCTAELIRSYHAESYVQRALQADLCIEIRTPAVEQLLGREPETACALIERARVCREDLTSWPTTELSTTGIVLLRSAARQRAWSAYRVWRTKEIARTIAALDHAEQIAPEHLAEAIQYCYRPMSQASKESL